jgi:hypothetical protein
MPGSSLSPGLTQRKSSTARDLLRKHYGLGLGSTGPSRQPPGKDKADPMDLGPFFHIPCWLLFILKLFACVCRLVGV